MKNFLTATVRAIKYGSQKWAADRQISRIAPDDGAPPVINSAYLIGCGRSGTTICGSVFKSHPSLHYFSEPYHLWATIDPTIDVLNFYHIGVASILLLDARSLHGCRYVSGIQPFAASTSAPAGAD